MSRINDYNEPEDTASFLRGCAFEANADRALLGRKGQRFLRELEAALLAMPEKRLSAGRLARTTINGSELCGEVCAIANAVYRLFEKRLHVCINNICEPRPASAAALGPTLFKLPPWVSEWITAFDFGKKVEPITFEIEPIERPEAVQMAEEMAVHSTK